MKLCNIDTNRNGLCTNCLKRDLATWLLAAQGMMHMSGQSAKLVRNNSYPNENISKCTHSVLSVYVDGPGATIDMRFRAWRVKAGAQQREALSRQTPIIVTMARSSLCNFGCVQSTRREMDTLRKVFA